MSTENVEAPEVVFVGGKAVEQHESMGSNLEPDERDAAKAAVKEAIQKAATEAGETAAAEAKLGKAKDPYKGPGASDKPLPERDSDGKFVADVTKQKADEPDEEELDLEKSSVKQLLKAREKVANLKKDAKDEISKAKAELQEQQKQLRDFYAQVEAEKHSLAKEREVLKALKKDPARAVREAGWDPEQFILDLAQDGTPEGSQKRQFAELQRQIEELKADKEARHAESKKYQEEQQFRQHQAHRQNAINTFVGLSQQEDKYPHVATFYKGRERALVAEGDLIAEEFRNLSGREGSFEQIMDYIEDELADRAKTWYTKSTGVGKAPTASPAKAAGSDTKPKVGSKGKTLNPEASGERRSFSSKDLSDLDADERHEAARQAVKVALANSQ